TAFNATGAFEVHLNRSGILSLGIFYAQQGAAEAHAINAGAVINVALDTGDEIKLIHVLKMSGMDTALGLLEPLTERRIKATPGASEADMEVVKDALRK